MLGQQCREPLALMVWIDSDHEDLANQGLVVEALVDEAGDTAVCDDDPGRVRIERREDIGSLALLPVGVEPVVQR